MAIPFRHVRTMIRHQPKVQDTFASVGFLLLQGKSDPGCTLCTVVTMTDRACL